MVTNHFFFVQILVSQITVALSLFNFLENRSFQISWTNCEVQSFI